MELKNRPTRKLKRNLEIVKRWKEGASYSQIAGEYNISVLRVRQIIEAWREYK